MLYLCIVSKANINKSHKKIMKVVNITDFESILFTQKNKISTIVEDVVVTNKEFVAYKLKVDSFTESFPTDFYENMSQEKFDKFFNERRKIKPTPASSIMQEAHTLGYQKTAANKKIFWLAVKMHYPYISKSSCIFLQGIMEKQKYAMQMGVFNSLYENEYRHLFISDLPIIFYGSSYYKVIDYKIQNKGYGDYKMWSTYQKITLIIVPLNGRDKVIIEKTGRDTLVRESIDLVPGN
jgi:hypothetical protein